MIFAYKNLTYTDFAAYYNAGSATLVLILIFIAIGIFVWYRIRRNRGVQLPTLHQDQVEEETIPLTRRGVNEGEDEDEGVMQQRKGKERLREPEPERELTESPIFNVGDSEDEEEYKRIASGK
jgi:carboxypeptidase D